MSVAKLHQVKKSLKPGICGKCHEELPKGSPYIWYTIGFRSRTRHIRCTKSSCYPKPSERESTKVAQILAAQEEFYETIDVLDTQQDIEQAVEHVAAAVRDVADEYREAADAWENGNEQADERAEHWESQADEIENWEWDGDESPEPEDFMESDEDDEDAEPKTEEQVGEAFGQAREAWLDEIREAAREKVEAVEFL